MAARKVVIFQGNGLSPVGALVRDCPRCGALRGYRCWALKRTGGDQLADPHRRLTTPHPERRTHRLEPTDA